MDFSALMVPAVAGEVARRGGAAASHPLDPSTVAD
jgi:hypothetical protein